MFESEVYYKSLDESLPNELSEQFEETLSKVSHTSMLHWTEHCTECAMPECFKTCSLYSPRLDDKCSRFVRGIEPIQLAQSSAHRVLKVQFKKWGVLSTQGNNYLLSLSEANKIGQNDLRIASLINQAPSKAIRKKLIQKRYSVKKNKIRKKIDQGNLVPDYFTVECYNPLEKRISITLTVRNTDAKFSKIPFQFRILIEHGYNKEEIPFSEIEKRVRTEIDYRIDLTPDEIDINHPLYFGLVEFVKLKSPVIKKVKGRKVKCVVWDLDNTIWHGILTENNKNQLRLREGVKDILTKLEAMGIIQSIASKNNHAEAFQALEHFNISTHFVFPKISWKPKSQSIRELIKDLNINPDTFLFIDDSDFEREEVQSVFPEITTLDAEKVSTLLEMNIFQTSVTSESKNRKTLYTSEEKRKDEAESFEGEYLDFLRSCKMQLELLSLEETYFERVYELTQRTNQMNFSGNVYQREHIQHVATNKGLDKFVMRCSDKFGNYGIVGFAIIDKKMNMLIDLMFSCRIQSKRVEHAFMRHCLNKYLSKGDFRVRYRRTDRNKFSAQVFSDFNFELEKKENNVHTLVFAASQALPDEDIVQIIT